MKVVIDGMAHLPLSDLTYDQVQSIQTKLTIKPRKIEGFPGDAPDPIYMFVQTDTHIQVPRAWYAKFQKPNHEILRHVVFGKQLWADDVQFSGILEPDQTVCVNEVTGRFRRGELGGLVRAEPGYGKTVIGLAIAAEMRVPTLIMVHKTVLLQQWKKRIARFIPNAKVGIAQGPECSFEGKDIVIGMNTSLHLKEYSKEFYEYFGLIISDEVHRVGAPTWSDIPAKFPAAWRLGLTATPNRSDGAQTVFYNHIGEIIYHGQIERLACKVKRVFTTAALPMAVQTNHTMVSAPMAMRILCANKTRNEVIVDNLIKAAQAGRKILVLSTIRGKHLVPLNNLFKAKWPEAAGPCPVTDFIVGGRKEAELDKAAEAQVIFATTQMAKEGLDIPPLDTLFIVSPIGNVEQAAGRIRRPFPGKKDPIIVDFRDDNIRICRDMGNNRWKFYLKKEWVTPE